VPAWSPGRRRPAERRRPGWGSPHPGRTAGWVRFQSALSAKLGQISAGVDSIRGDDKPITGTRLIREYHGVEHSVTVLHDGYEYQGRPYQSLSAIARAITGTRWNGWLFFGLKNRRAAA
jgi:hypothetical protein